MLFKTIFADLPIAINVNSPNIEGFLDEYLVDEATQGVFSVSVGMEEIYVEDDKTSGIHFSVSYLETLAILRKISEILPSYQRFLMHGATISYEGKGYMFTALSGVGKSTHIKLWKKYFGDKVTIVNGDKPFLWVKDEEVRVYGSPWAGKEHWHTNTSAALNGICFLKRGMENRISRISPEDCLPLMMRQVYWPADSITAGMTLELLDKMLKLVPLYVLECDISEDAVQTSFETLTGLNYEASRVKENREDCTYAD